MSSDSKTGIVILGATGSIGKSTLDVIEELDGDFRVVGLACHSNWQELATIAERVGAEAVAIVDEESRGAARAADAFASSVSSLGGAGSLCELAAWDGVDVVLNAVVGAAGLPATLAGLTAGRRVALANKESLVVGGELVMSAASGSGELLPVDSEHSAIWQLLENRPSKDVTRIILTASGGPFRRTSADRLKDVTVQDALAHPTWSMGPKITIDSATLANKGLEIIEAHHLFGTPYDRIDVVIHPQSIVHGMVECIDGSLLAELGPPDMRLPIQRALMYPERTPRKTKIDITAFDRLEFEEPDDQRFPALQIARAAGEAGGTAPAVFNAANEVAVSMFLDERITFLEIPALCEKVLAEHEVTPASSVEALLEADNWARERAQSIAGGRRRSTIQA